MYLDNIVIIFLQFYCLEKNPSIPKDLEIFAYFSRRFWESESEIVMQITAQKIIKKIEHVTPELSK